MHAARPRPSALRLPYHLSSPLHPWASCPSSSSSTPLPPRRISRFSTAAPVPGPAGNNNAARWLSDTKLRLGRLFFHGTTAAEASQAGAILRDLTRNWRLYAAGSEGFLAYAGDEAQAGREAGLFRHKVAWGDMDSMTARVNWACHIAKHVDPENAALWTTLWTPKGTGMILRSIKVDFKFPVTFPDRITVYHKLGTVGEDNFTLDVIIFSEKHQRPAARAYEDIVMYNYVDTPPRKAPIPRFMRDVFEATLQRQKEVALDAAEAMRDVEAEVTELERRVLARKEMV